MARRFVIALTLEARRAAKSLDLASYIEDKFPDKCRILERGYGGKSVTVEMPASYVRALREAMPFATVEPLTEIQLLDPARLSKSSG